MLINLLARCKKMTRFQKKDYLPSINNSNISTHFTPNLWIHKPRPSRTVSRPKRKLRKNSNIKPHPYKNHPLRMLQISSSKPVIKNPERNENLTKKEANSPKRTPPRHKFQIILLSLTRSKKHNQSKTKNNISCPL